MEFKDIFKDLREKRGKSQQEIAEDLGVTDGSVSNWETGQRNPNVKRLQQIADYFNVSPSYLMGEEPLMDDSYYIDREAARLADFLHKRPEYKVLFDASQKVKPEDIDRVAKMIDLMGGQGNAG